MTVEEFSNEFDTLFNLSDTVNINLNEYEKSVFLTKAQEEIVLNYYKGNNYAEGFEQTEEVRKYLSSLQQYLEIPSNEGTQIKTINNGFYDFRFTLDKVWFITYEYLIPNETKTCYKNKRIEIIPTTQDELSRTLENPFKTANNRRALRLEYTNGSEIISIYKDFNYFISFIKKPNPIILTNLGDMSIDNISTKQECTLHEALHRPILQRAVQLALITKGLIKQS